VAVGILIFLDAPSIFYEATVFPIDLQQPESLSRFIRAFVFGSGNLAVCSSSGYVNLGS
jgi:hypothetical protein